MIEKIVYDYLTAQLPSVNVSMEKPAAQTGNFIVIEKTGSGRSNYIDNATIAIQSYSDSMLGAATLNEEVKAAMDAIIQLDTVSACRLNSDYNFTDTASKHYRYQAVYDLYY